MYKAVCVNNKLCILLHNIGLRIVYLFNTYEFKNVVTEVKV